MPHPSGGDVQLYIARTNYAGQGYRWARAAERIPNVTGANLTLLMGEARFPSDFAVPYVVSEISRQWQRKHFESVASGFSNVLIEACAPMFGPLFGGDVRREIKALQERGVRVGMISHGSEVRLPSRHREAHAFSPFHVMAPERVELMERVAQNKLALLKDLGLPCFVSTPALLIEQPDATWLPVAIDTEVWASERIPLVREVPVVVHAPSREVMKRSDLIDEALMNLHEQGAITYRRITGVPNSEMPSVLAGADVLVDAVGTGNYGVAACEGMASGCVVVSYIDSQVADFVSHETGRDLPIVHTEPNEVSDTILRIIDDRPRYQALAAAGLPFVTEIHDGARSAESLRKFLNR